jgi:DNA-binding PadR family transcriptional regulator
MATSDQDVPLRSVELHILLSVVDRPRHGYAILQEAEERTNGRPGFEIPTLYRALRRLRTANLIRLADPPDPDSDERREYWEATGLGRRALEAELARMEVAVAVGRARTKPASALRAAAARPARAGADK